MLQLDYGDPRPVDSQHVLNKAYKLQVCNHPLIKQTPKLQPISRKG